jgi:perosamine synthetase
MTFAATAEVVRYQGAVPILVDCDEVDGNMRLGDAEQKIADLRAGKLGPKFPRDLPVVGVMPVHVGGLMLDMGDVRAFARRHGLWIVEDAAHAFPAAWRADETTPWQRCGEGTADVSCFSFYANKTITTGEGGMAVTDDGNLAERIRCMSLHGLSRDAWQRYAGGSWDYHIVAAGYKYNLTDIASAIGIHQLARAEEMRKARAAIAAAYFSGLSDCEEISLPRDPADRLHAWHLFPIRVRPQKLQMTRDQFLEELREAGIGCSVHWRPLHLHPYYEEEFAWTPDQLPVASQIWQHRLSLPIFPGMRDEEQDYVIETIRNLCRRRSRSAGVAVGAREEDA